MIMLCYVWPLGGSVGVKTDRNIGQKQAPEGIHQPDLYSSERKWFTTLTIDDFTLYLNILKIWHYINNIIKVMRFCMHVV